MQTNSLEFMALEDEMMDDDVDLGEMDVTGNSALDMLGGDDGGNDDIAAKMDLE